MVRNFFKVALRNMRKQSLFSFINILGLSIGMAASLFVILYVTDELSYDKFHADIDKMYRIDLSGSIAGQEIITTNSCPPLGPAMVTEIPEIASSLRMQRLTDVVIKIGTESFIEEDKMLFADSNFFEFFDFILLEGDPGTVLNKPNSVVITEEMAHKYFGEEPAVGQQLVAFNDNTNYQVTGVAADPPANSHFRFRILFTTEGVDRFQSPIWLNNGYQTYVKGHEPLNIPVVDAKIADLTVERVGPQLEQFMGATFEQFLAQGNAYGYTLRPVKDIHLHSKIDDELEAGGDIKYVYLFIAIGIFIILIACINFMNLSTAKSAGRAKEVGLRKTLGSLRGQLIRQFLVESLIFSILSGLLAVTLVYLLLPAFNMLAAKAIPVSALFTAEMIGVVVAITVLVGLLAGSYPAFYLTAFRPADVMKGRIRTGAKSGKLRGALVVAQFAISIILIVCTLVVYQQLRFTQNVNLGFNRHNALVVQNTSRLETDRLAFKDNLTKQTGIKVASYTNNIIPGVNNTTAFRSTGSDIDHLMGTYLGDYEHVPALGYTIVAGRNFSRDFPADSSAILVNEAVVKEMSWQNPVGEHLTLTGNDVPMNFTVVGVLKDFHFESLHANIRPLVIRFLTEANRMVVRFEDGVAPAEAVALVAAEWQKLSPNELFQYEFLDENFDALYRSEQRLGQIFYLFTGIAIFIACLGLFGLAAFVAEQRTKEIGIRKAMGASITSITSLLSKEFARYVLIAIVISIYPAYYVMSDWLEGFAYRIGLSPWIFLGSGAIALIIALITVSFQAFKAARVNPVDSLKYE
jgi:putative ABC transport system permease protein